MNDWLTDKTQAAQISLLFEAVLALQRDVRTIMTNQQVLEQQVADLGTAFGLIETFLTNLESRLVDANEQIAELTEENAENRVDLTPLIGKVTELKNFAAGLNPESPTPPAETNPEPDVPEPTPTTEEPAAEEPAAEEPTTEDPASTPSDEEASPNPAPEPTPEPAPEPSPEPTPEPATEPTPATEQPSEGEQPVTENPAEAPAETIPAAEPAPAPAEGDTENNSDVPFPNAGS